MNLKVSRHPGARDRIVQGLSPKFQHIRKQDDVQKMIQHPLIRPVFEEEEPPIPTSAKISTCTLNAITSPCEVLGILGTDAAHAYYRLGSVKGHPNSTKLVHKSRRAMLGAGPATFGAKFTQPTP